MDASASRELESIKGELRSIIGELESISYGVKGDFEGIGNDICANCIDNVRDNYKKVLSKLNNMDTSTVTASYAEAHSGGGGGRF